jgi:hypothetical protein
MARVSDRFKSRRALAEDAVREALLAHGNGNALPGFLGLGHNLLKVWTNEYHGPRWLRHVARTVESAAVGYAFYHSRESSTDGVEIENKTERWLKDNKYERFDFGGYVWDLFRSILLTLPHTYRQFAVEEDKRKGRSLEGVHLYETPAGTIATFSAIKTDPLSGEEDDIYAKAGTHDAILAFAADVLWEQYPGGMRVGHKKRTSHGERVVHAVSLEDAQPHLLDEEDKQSADALAQRLALFAARGEMRGVVLYGPPGTGKTTLARHVGTASYDGRVLVLDDVLWDDPVSWITQLTQFLRPRAIFIDDMDRRKMRAGLRFLSTATCNVIGTVNTLGKLDRAYLRPGRFDEVRPVPIPRTPHLVRITLFYCELHGIADDAAEAVAAAVAEKRFSPAEIQELVLSLSVCGVDQLAAEVLRLDAQRKHYADAFDDGMDEDDFDPDCE